MKLIESHYFGAFNVQGAKPEDIVLILSHHTKDYEALPAYSFLYEKFPGLEIKIQDEFEGFEKSVVFNFKNDSTGTSTSIIPVSLTRVNSHLVIFSEDFRNILKDATDKGLVKSKTDFQTIDTNAGDFQIPTSLAEASEILCSMARQMTLSSIQSLA